MESQREPGGAGGTRPGIEEGGSNYPFERAPRQQFRLLRYLREHGSVSTLEARNRLHIMHPAARVLELRRQGYGIVTTWDVLRSADGAEHRIGRYLLQGQGRPQDGRIEPVRDPERRSKAGG